MAGPPMGGQAATPGVYGQAAGAYNSALAGTQAAGAGPNIGAFMNPFTQGVIDPALANLNRARQMGINDIGAAASSAGAFGGSRHGIAEAETNRAFADQAGQLSAGLLSQGFNTALGGAQNQQQIGLQAAGQMGNLAGQGFGFGQQIGQQQAQQGAQQQGLLQAIINAAKGQFAGYTGAPQASLGAPLAALGAIPNGGGQTQTTQQRPGLFNYLGLALGL